MILVSIVVLSIIGYSLKKLLFPIMESNFHTYNHDMHPSLNI
jgi:hypothetical protein